MRSYGTVKTYFDVRGLEIAVNDASFMRGRQGVGDLFGDR
jgi:hypothetical protein